MLNNKIRSFLSKAYGLSFALIPEELMAQQVVVDALTVFFVNAGKSIVQNEESLDEFNLTNHRDEIFKQIYKIALKRFLQQNQFWKDEIKKLNEFHQLPLEQKGVITLFYRMNYKIDEISYVLQMKKSEVIEHLNNARNRLAKGVMEANG